MRQFNGVQDTDYVINNTLGVQAQIWSPCGADINLRASVGMMLRNSSYEDAMATVDSADISAGIVYQLQWKRCY